ncbi:hypothetical protein BESB_070860 [Besnoitia besnoiti]|uniref:Toxoplasma gondii family A protein n=1 Tax=Besnoitia besnoiti TaxID=94643 RepID=A0A2A9M9P8_BESBE|nr:uncharacterized protein BESB_070860 [Besnoitia besnoiti]PFH33934.1 hypothetical protein BESB_070860 [Besnoitia besnoiti]
MSQRIGIFLWVVFAFAFVRADRQQIGVAAAGELLFEIGDSGLIANRKLSYWMPNGAAFTILDMFGRTTLEPHDVEKLAYAYSQDGCQLDQAVEYKDLFKLVPEDYKYWDISQQEFEYDNGGSPQRVTGKKMVFHSPPQDYLDEVVEVCFRLYDKTSKHESILIFGNIARNRSPITVIFLAITSLSLLPLVEL